MSFDIRTLSIITALSSLVFAFAMVTVARLVSGSRHLRDWAVGTSLAALSTLLVGLRGIAPDLLSIVGANTLLAWAFVLFYQGCRGLVGRARIGGVIFGVPVVAAVCLAWFTFVQPSVPARVLVVSLFMVPLLAMSAFEFWQHDRRMGGHALRIANYLTIVILALGVWVFAGRIYPAFSGPNMATYTQSSSVLFIAPYLWAILFNLWLAIFVTLTVSSRLQRDLVVARDVAEQHSRAKGQFLANMSHEIRTPMNAILGMLQLLQGTELNARQQDYISKTQGAARSLLGLLNDILDFSKVEAGKMTLDPQPFSPDQLLRDLSVVLSANVADKGIDVLFDVDPALPTVLVGDAMRLQQVLLNLGGNAIKFTQKGQVVMAIGLQSQHAGVARLQFSVQDSGIGIAPERQADIFTGFSQAEASTTRRFGGTGLGLSISQRLVELMGGTLQLTSEPGQGSTFSFSVDFPIAESAPARVDAPSVQPALRSVLVVASNLVGAALIAKVTRARGWPTTVVHSGEQALDCVRAQATPHAWPFEVIYLDGSLSGQDVWETARQLRAFSHAQGGLQPAIILLANTNRASFSQRTPQEQTWFADVVVKPFTPSMLVEAAQRLPMETTRMRPTGRAPKPSQRLSGMRILVVEDNLINQQVAKELLGAEGAVIVLAANGQLGVEAVAAAQPPFDVVLMDVQMPVMDGLEATRAIRMQLGLTDLPVIAMTANAMDSDRADCLAAGMNDHVGKPFDLDQLIARLHHWAPGARDSELMPTTSTP